MARNSARDRFRVDDGKSGRRRRPERGEDADRRFHLLDGGARDDGAVERMDICGWRKADALMSLGIPSSLCAGIPQERL